LWAWNRSRPGNLLRKIRGGTPRAKAAKHFERLLDACEELARSRALSKITAGINLARHKAYRKMLARGFRAEMQGVSMHRPNEPGYSGQVRMCLMTGADPVQLLCV
jgi:hypothetical protein